MLPERRSEAGGGTGDRSSAFAGGEIVLQLDRVPRSRPPGPLHPQQPRPTENTPGAIGPLQTGENAMSMGVGIGLQAGSTDSF